MDDSLLFIIRCCQKTSESKGHVGSKPLIPILLTKYFYKLSIKNILIKYSLIY